MITINNQLQGNPNAILNDNEGNTIYVNDYSGMDVGQSTLTPIDEYQIWFDSYQNTGTIIAHNVSNAGTVTFSGGVASQTISYTSEGQWVAGDLPSSSDVDLSAVGAATNTLAVQVVALFSKALTAGAVTFLLSKLIDKFADNLRPTTITAGAGNATLKFEFANGPDGDAQVTSMDSYEDAVNDALKALRNEKNSPIANEKWGISEPDVAVFYGN